MNDSYGRNDDESTLSSSTFNTTIDSVTKKEYGSNNNRDDVIMIDNIECRSINERTSISFDNDNNNNFIDKIMIEDNNNKRMISIAWHNLSYDFDYDPSSTSDNNKYNDNNNGQQNHQNNDSHRNSNYRKMFNKISLKKLLLFHQRRGSVPSTPTRIVNNNPNSDDDDIKNVTTNSNSKIKSIHESVKKKQQQQQKQYQSSPILRRLTGHFETKTVNGLLGPSYHARQTFLKCLTGSIRYRSGISKESRIYWNNNLNPIELIKKRSSYVAWIVKNLDGLITFEQMSVLELLKYSFLFHNNGFPLSLLFSKKFTDHIEKIFETLSLNKDNLLNKKIRDCKYDEKRMISIAQELMSLHSMPVFMFLDEPFDNLDIITIEKILLILRNLSQKYSMTIIISGESYDAYLITLLDKLYVLSHGGVCIYSGSPNSLLSTMKNDLLLKQSSSSENDDNNDENQYLAIEEMLKILCLEFNNTKVRKLADKTLINEHRYLSQHRNELNYQSNNGIDIPSKSFQFKDFLIQSFRYFRLLYLNRWFPFKLSVTIIYYLILALFLIDKKTLLANRCYDSISDRLIVPSNQTCQKIIHVQFMIDGYITYQMYSMWFISSWSILMTTKYCLKMLNLFRNDYQNRRYSFTVYSFSSFFINLFESIFCSTIFTCLMYFLIDHSVIDHNRSNINNATPTIIEWFTAINFKRFGMILLSYWLLYLYHQTYGILLNILLYPSIKYLNNPSLIIITIGQILVLIFQLLSNNILVIIERIHLRIIATIVKNIISLHSIYNLVLYAIYGLERDCDYKHFLKLQSHYNHHHNFDSQSLQHQQQQQPHHYYDHHSLNRYSSSVFYQYSIPLELNEILSNLLPAICIMIAIRFISFLLLCYYFAPKFYILSCLSSNYRQSSPSSMVLNTKDLTKTKSLEIIPIDYGPINRKKSKVRIIHPILKDDDEIEFCRNKIQLAWRSLSLLACCKKPYYFIRKNYNNQIQSSNLILNNLNGQFNIGSMNAVIGGGNIGGNHCCKTIYGYRDASIRALLLRIFSGQLKTRLSLDTKFYESKYAPNNVCFISRHSQEHLISGLTAKQSLIYSSMIKNIDDDYDYNRLDHEEMALNILDELDLGHRSGTCVENCNQSERKRLALALELTSLQMPNLICIDEPTFGLDAINAEQFVRCLRQLTDRHSITFVISFQYAQHHILSQFDQLYCISSNGKCLYSGPSTTQSIRKHLNQSITISKLETFSKRAIEELFRYSCMDYREISTEIEELSQQCDKKILKTNESLSKETVSLEFRGIRSNVPSFSVKSLFRLSRRYRGRWLNSLWFQWIIYATMFSMFALLLNGLFGSQITQPDGCIRKDVFNATSICPQYRTATKMIWEKDGEQLWDNYRYVYISTNLFLTIALLKSALYFYREIKVFLSEHQNGWYSSTVFYISHFTWIDNVPMIPITMIYLYIIDIDHSDYHHYEPDEIVDNDQQSPYSYYWWSIILIWIAIESIHSISHLIIIISTNRIRSETAFLILICMSGLMTITSNYQIKTESFLSYLNISRYLNEAILVLHYGYFHSCTSPSFRSSYIRQQQRPISLILYRIDSNDLNPNEHFYHCLRILIYQTIIFRLCSWCTLLIRSNGDRIFHHHRLWMNGKFSPSQSSSSSSYLDNYRLSLTNNSITNHDELIMQTLDEKQDRTQQQQQEIECSKNDLDVAHLSSSTSSSQTSSAFCSSLDNRNDHSKQDTLNDDASNSSNDNADDDDKLEFHL